MNYLRELNSFRDWSMLNSPSTGQIALWYSLMSINNATGWVDWFTAANQTLQLMTGLSRQGLDKARNQLVQKGLIEYRKGISNQAGKYHMVSFECQKVGTEAVTEAVTAGAFQLSHQERFGGTLFKQNETRQDGDDNARKLFTAYQEIFVTGMNSIQQQDLLEFLDKGMDVDLMILDFKTAKRNDAGFSYAFAIIKNQFEAGVKTIAQHETVEARRQAAVGGDLSAQYSSNRRTSSAQRETTVRKSITGGKVGRI